MTEPFTFDPEDGLLVVHVINDFAHDDGERLLASFRERLNAMTKVIAAARTAGVPVVYANDERGAGTATRQRSSTLSSTVSAVPRSLERWHPNQATMFC